MTIEGDWIQTDVARYDGEFKIGEGRIGVDENDELEEPANGGPTYTEELLTGKGLDRAFPELSEVAQVVVVE